uniref:BTB domain-containing protein n=1 Tax=Guillardia theta TaxID=55529 RepID=A0A7S4UKA6_GUITH|mmetsp:Transcript_44552/g.140565  ORF Transcript_44552/g.140565 Transcript_44552/m.140565 type:complete len:768 (+) Transcript_44552:153-2456(+)
MSAKRSHSEVEELSSKRSKKGTEKDQKRLSPTPSNDKSSKSDLGDCNGTDANRELQPMSRMREEQDLNAIVLKSQSIFADPMFREMWLKREFCDLFFRVEPNKVLCAHRVVLAAHSSHLQSRLYRQEEKDKSRTGSTTAVGGFDDDSTLGPIIELQDSQYEAVLALLDYVYSGSCCIERSVGRDLMDLACRWGLDGIRQALETQGMLSLTVTTCAEFLKKCFLDYVAASDGAGGMEQHGLSADGEVNEDWIDSVDARRGMELALARFEEVAETPQFLDLPEPIVAALIANDRLAVTSEKVVLNVIYEWMTKNAAEYGPEVLVKDGGKKVRGEDLLRLVRWTQLQTDFLASFGYWNKPSHLKDCRLMEMHVFEAMAYGHLPPDMKNVFEPRILNPRSLRARKAAVLFRPLERSRKSLILKASGRKVAVSAQSRTSEVRHGAMESVGMNGSDGIDAAAAPAVCTAVFGHSTQSATHSYVLEWHAGTESSGEADGYIGVMNATTLEENDSACFVLRLRGKLGEGQIGLAHISESGTDALLSGCKIQLTVNVLERRLALFRVDESGNCILLQSKDANNVAVLQSSLTASAEPTAGAMDSLRGLVLSGQQLHMDAHRRASLASLLSSHQVCMEPSDSLVVVVAAIFQYLSLHERVRNSLERLLLPGRDVAAEDEGALGSSQLPSRIELDQPSFKPAWFHPPWPSHRLVRSGARVAVGGSQSDLSSVRLVVLPCKLQVSPASSSSHVLLEAPHAPHGLERHRLLDLLRVELRL